MFNPKIFENSQPDGFGVLEVVDGGEEKGPRSFVALRRSELHGEIAGPLAALRLAQTFSYTREECDKVLEAVYRFPLPGDAAVTGVSLRFGQVEIRAELRERAEAEATYEEAKRAGKQAALLTRESPDVFTLRVAGLRPDEAVVVETSYVQLARPELFGWSLRVPLTTAPRYVREDERGSHHAAGQPLLVLRDPGHRFALDLRVRGAQRIESGTHHLELSPLAGDAQRVRLKGGEVLPDRDCVLTWRAVPKARPVLQAWAHADGDDLYFLALLAPPSQHEAGRGAAREAILLVDHSGSMSGAKWEAADWAVERFLSDLAERDAFALGVFHDIARWFDPTTQPAMEHKVADAVDFLQKAKDTSGTNLGVALEQALKIPPAQLGDEAARHVLVVTDAQVSDEGRILRLVDDEAKKAPRRRISVLCIDAAPNEFLTQEMASRGGGVAKFLTSDPQQGDITTALDEVLADWSEPVAANLKLEINRAQVEGAAGRQSVPASQIEPSALNIGGLPAGDPQESDITTVLDEILAGQSDPMSADLKPEINRAEVGGAAGRQSVAASQSEWSALDIGDLPAGRVLWIAGRAPKSHGSWRLRVTDARGRIVALCAPQSAGDEAVIGPALKALFGARRVLGLEFLMHSYHADNELRDRLRRLGYDPAEVEQVEGSIYPENQREALHQALRGLLVREALRYGLASAETAFVAVRHEAGKPVEQTVAVANALPHGWDAGFSVGGAAAPMAMSPMPSAPPSRLAAFGATDFSSPSADVPTFLRRGGPPASRRGLFGRALAKSVAVEDEAPSEAPLTVLFSGAPQFAGLEAVLFDSANADTAWQKLVKRGRLSRLRVKLRNAKASLPDYAVLLIFVDDLAVPRAKVKLADVLRHKGERPLNLAVQTGQAVRIVLRASSEVPALEVAVG